MKRIKRIIKINNDWYWEIDKDLYEGLPIPNHLDSDTINWKTPFGLKRIKT